MAPPKKRQRVVSDSEDDHGTFSADLFTTTSESHSNGGDDSEDEYVPPTPKKASNGSKKLKPATTPKKASPKKTTTSTTNTPVKNKAKAPSLTPTPKAKRITKPRSTTASPAKGRRGSAAANKVSKPQMGITSFFAKQAALNKNGAGAGKQTVELTQRRTSSLDDELDDAIESDFSDDGDLFRNSKSPMKKEPGLSQATSKPRWPPKFSTPATKQPSDIPADPRTWAEKHAPQTTAELAVHKKKIEDVRNVLERIFAGVSSKRLLVLSGPSGSGKTATIQALANELDFEILEWRNPTAQEFGKANRTGVPIESLNAQFDEFLNRGMGYGQLKFSTSKDPGADDDDEFIKEEPDVSDDDGLPKRKVILVEDLPNIFSSSQSSALTSFRQTLQRFIATQQAIAVPPVPCVLIISETLSTQAHSHSITPHRLLGPQMLSNIKVSAIQFNKIAPTIIQKTLEKVVEMEARRMGMRTLPSQGLLAGLGYSGDIRSAVNALQFMMIGGDGGNFSASVAVGPGKKKKERGMKGWGEASETEKATLEMITQRETALGIFHAVGKVIYNKRTSDPQTPSSSYNPTQVIQYNPPPPKHLIHHHRLPSMVDIPNLLDYIGTDIDTFVSAVHENYLPSCQGSDFVETMDACSEALSDSDLLLNTSGGNSKGGLAYTVSPDLFGSADAMRSLELSFQVAVRGVLHGLPSPVKRDPGRTKIYYPMALRLWREKETVEGLVSLFSSGRNGLTAPSSVASAINGVPSLQRADSGGGMDGIGAGRGTAPDEAITDILPYLYKILKPAANGNSTKSISIFQRAAMNRPSNPSFPTSSLGSGNSATKKRYQHPPVPSKTIRNIEKIVLFSGVGDQSEKTPEEMGIKSDSEDEKLLPIGEEDEFGNVKTDPKMKRLREQAGTVGQYGSRFKKRKDGGVGILGAFEDSKGSSGKDRLEDDVDKLVLSDDDIEDFD